MLRVFDPAVDPATIESRERFYAPIDSSGMPFAVSRIVGRGEQGSIFLVRFDEGSFEMFAVMGLLASMSVPVTDRLFSCTSHLHPTSLYAEQPRTLFAGINRAQPMRDEVTPAVVKGRRWSEG